LKINISSRKKKKKCLKKFHYLAAKVVWTYISLPLSTIFFHFHESKILYLLNWQIIQLLFSLFLLL
jgi:hypothetical protein